MKLVPLLPEAPQWERTSVILLYTVWPIGLLTAFVATRSGVPSSVQLAGFMALLLVLVVGMSIHACRSMRRISYRVEAENGSICRKCEHSLLGQPQCGRCPECGESFDLTELQMFWRGRVDNYASRIQFMHPYGFTILVLCSVLIVLFTWMALR